MTIALETVACDLCGSEDWTLYIEIPDLYPDTDMRFVQCNQCGLVFVNPRPTGAARAAYYDAHRTPEYLTNVQRKVEHHHSLMNQLLTPYYREGRKLLEVGCAFGEFLKRASEVGWDIHGVEPNRFEAHVASERLGIEVFAGDFDSYPTQHEYFDAVAFIDVLEHLPSPRLALEKAWTLLKPEGILLLNVPHLKHPDAHENPTRFWGQFHLYFFTEDTLRLLLLKTGFAPETLCLMPFVPLSKKTKSMLRKVGGSFIRKLQLRVVSKVGGSLVAAGVTNPAGLHVLARKSNPLDSGNEL